MADETREITGGTPAAGDAGAPIVLFERAAGVRIERNGIHFDTLSPSAARYLAGKLYRLARRIEKRSE